jgi:hypothetical protein
MPWSDCPFEVWRQPEEERGPLAGEAGEGLLLTTVLVDALSGIVKVIRVTTWPAEFADRVRASVARQLEAPYSSKAAGVALAAVYERYDSATLARERADVRC